MWVADPSAFFALGWGTMRLTGNVRLLPSSFVLCAMVRPGALLLRVLRRRGLTGRLQWHGVPGQYRRTGLLVLIGSVQGAG